LRGPLWLGLLLVIGCASQAPPRSEGLPIPPALKPHVTRSFELGHELYLHDWMAARGTDALVEKLGSLDGRGLGGYLPLQEADAVGVPLSSWVVIFYTDEPLPRIAYQVRLWESGEPSPVVEDFDPPKAADDGFLRLIRARQAAIDSLALKPQPLNPVVVPGEWFDEPGSIVYLIAATTRPNVAVLGQHFRVFVSEDGKTVRRVEPLSKSILEVPFADDAVSIWVTHLITDWPLETHVLASLICGKTLYVGTEDGAVWRVDGEAIALIRAAGTHSPPD